MKHVFLWATILSLMLIFTPLPAHADDCVIVYGGGKMDCPQTSPTPATGAPTNTTSTVQTTPTPTPHQTFPTVTQTKGGLTVQQPVKTKTTPATGPEVFSLIGLIPAAAAGFWLRKKA